jgi:hypothetical protein
MKIFKNNYSRKAVWQISGLFVFFFFLFMYIAFRLSSDLPIHARFAREISEGVRNYPGNFILYGLMNILSFCLSKILFFAKIHYRSIGLCLLLAMAVTYKFRWACKHLQVCSADWKRFLMALSLLLVVAIPIPSIFITKYWYLGNFTPNIWHNSTTIFLFPFAIVLFSMSIKQLEIFDNRRNLWMLLLIFLNVFIKPSYFFVWVCIYPIFLLAEYRFTSKFFKGMFPVIAGVVFLVICYIWIYYFNNIVAENSSVIIKPFWGYGYFAPLSMLPWALLFSLLFPIVYLALNFKRLYKNKVFLFVYASLVVAIVIFLLFLETGIRMGNGNFYWQIVICTWLCFFISISDWLKHKKELMQTNNLKKKIVFVYFPAVIYAIHVIVGILYLVRYAHIGHYF